MGETSDATEANVRAACQAWLSTHWDPARHLLDWRKLLGPGTRETPRGRLTLVHVRRGGRSFFVESVYAHLDTLDVSQGESVERGTLVGTIGDADGTWIAHLHFEMRRSPGLPLGPGYGADSGHHMEPSAFLLAHR